MLLNKFFDYFNYIKKDIVQQSFMIENLVNKILEDLYIQIQNKYTEFTKKLNKQLEVK